MVHDAYVAGLIDGEGGIAIVYRPRRGGRSDMQCYIHLAITMTDRAPLDAMSERFGGSVYCYQQPNPRWSDWYRWQRSGRNAEAVLRAAYPYAIVKKRHIEICFRHQELRMQGGRAKPARAQKNAEYMDERLALREQLRIINRRGKEDDGERRANRPSAPRSSPARP